MEASSFMGTTMMVDEIISEALQVMKSGDYLPASEESALSFLQGPTARSTSIHARIPGLAGYRSFTDDVLKSFAEKDSVRPTAVSEQLLQQSDDNPFAGHQNCDGFDSTGEFVSAEKLLNEFDNDEKRCREENMFKDNRAVSFECSSISVSPDKLARKQVSPPDWAKNVVDLQSLSIFGPNESQDNSLSSRKTSATIDGGDSFRKKTEAIASHYNPRLPHCLGVIVPGVSSVFELPVLPSDVVSVKTNCYLDETNEVHFSSVERTPTYLRLTLSPPSSTCGRILIHLEMPPYRTLELSAFCLLPAFKLPERLVLPADTCVEIPMSLCFPFPICLPLQIKSTHLVDSTEVFLTPKTKSIPLKIRVRQNDRNLEVQIFNKGQPVAELGAILEVRKFNLSVNVTNMGVNSALSVTNDERFAVQAALSDNLGTLSYKNTLSLQPGETFHLTSRTIGTSVSTEQIATFKLTITSPCKTSIDGEYSLTIPATRALRPNLDRFVWLAEEETAFSMVDNLTGQPAEWNNSTVISPCPLIQKYLKVVPDSSDKSKVLLKVSRPPHFLVGRLRFFKQASNGKPSGPPYGFRYPFLVPEEPQLRFYTPSVNSASRVYQLPLDGKLKVSNLGNHDVFIVAANERLVLRSKNSAVLSFCQPGKIFYGLESWRRIVKSRTATQREEIDAEVSHDFSTSRMMDGFKGESHSPVDETIFDKIPDDRHSLLRLYQLFVTTIQSVRLERSAINSTFLNGTVSDTS